MQISSNDTQSILSIARQSALEKRSKDKNGNELDASTQSSSSSSDLSVSRALQLDSSQQSFAASLASSALNTKSVPTTTADGSYKVTPKDTTGQVTSLLTDLNGSDIDLIEKATGSTYVDGDFVGGDQEGGQDLLSALWAMRKAGTGSGAMANPINGDITASDLQDYIANRGQTIGNYTAIDKALSILSDQEA